MAEQLGLDQGLRNGRAVHRDQGRLGTPGQVVQGACDQFLAGAGLALDQYIGIGGRDLANLAVEVLHGGAGADDADLAVGAFRGFLRATTPHAACGSGCRGGPGFLAVPQDAGDGLQHLVVVEGLGDVVDRTHLHRVHRRAQAGVAGHDQHRGAFGQFDQFGTRCAGQAQVADDQVEAGNAVAFLGFLYRARFADLVLVTFEQTAQGRADNGFVFDDKNMWHQFVLSAVTEVRSAPAVAVYIATDVASTCLGRVTRIRVPSWRSGSAGLSIVICP